MEKIEKILSDLRLLEINESLEENDAFASITLNPTLRWIRFVLTDDQPNENKQRVPQAEFDNLIKTGIHMPIKMAEGGISLGHDGTKPLGVITNLKKVANKIEGLAALWSRERPEDVELIVNEFKAGRVPQISWEIPYTDIITNEEGIQDLVGICLRAATIVGLPAYAGRTPILAVASRELEEEWYMKETESAKWTRAYINDLPDSAFLYIEPGGEKDEDGKTVPRTLRHLPVRDADGNIDLPHLRNAIARLEQENTGTKDGETWLTESLREKLLKKARNMLESAKSSFKENDNMNEIEELKAQLDEALSEISRLKEALNAANAELEMLRDFKASIEKEHADAEKLSAIKAKFTEAGIEKDNDYFVNNKDMLLALDESAIDFMIQELVAFASKKHVQNKGKEGIPGVFDSTSINTDNIKSLAQLLRERHIKK